MRGSSRDAFFFAARAEIEGENVPFARPASQQLPQPIPVLQEYVLVSQHPRVEIYRRLSSGSWEYRDVQEGVVTLASGAALDLSILYADLPH